MNKLSVSDLSYIAGVVDGEGCIGISRYRKNYHYNFQYLQYCNVVNTNEDLLHWLRDSTRVGIIRPRKVKGNRKPSFEWSLRNYEIKEFLETIHPYLKIKKRQAEIMLEFLSLIRYVGPNHPQTEGELEHKLRLFIEMQFLNERGPSNQF